MATLKAGCLGYIDSFVGLVPCKVLSVIDTTKRVGMSFELTSGTGSTAHNVTARITANRPGYKRGEVISGTSLHIVPRDAVRFKKYSARIDAFYVEFDGGTNAQTK